jgi:RNA polymerase-binding protein DksA
VATNDQRTEESAWSTKRLHHFERRLVEERRDAMAQMGQLTGELRTSLEAATGETTSWRFHMADIGTEEFEREQSFLLASREGQLLWHIDQALRRLYKSPETFGVCDQCGNRIAFERLDVIPYVTRCVACKQDWERGGKSEQSS